MLITHSGHELLKTFLIFSTPADFGLKARETHTYIFITYEHHIHKMYIKTIWNGESDVPLKAVGAQIHRSVLPDSIKTKMKQITSSSVDDQNMLL